MREYWVNVFRDIDGAVWQSVGYHRKITAHLASNMMMREELGTSLQYRIHVRLKVPS